MALDSGGTKATHLASGPVDTRTVKALALLVACPLLADQTGPLHPWLLRERRPSTVGGSLKARGLHPSKGWGTE